MKSKIKKSGKSLVFTDLHIGVSNDKESRQNIARKFVDEIINQIALEGIEQVFFLGDLFHHRTSIEVTSLNVANELVRKLASKCEVFLLQGNHDLYEKNNSNITSLNIFELDNVNLISVPTELTLNGQKVLLVPWLCGSTLDEYISKLNLSDKYDIMMGHFDISYSGDIKTKGAKYAESYKGMGAQIKSDSIVGDIMNHTSDYSTIYLGHIHDHETFTFANRNWNIVGSPQYQVHDMQRLPESKKMHGYYILDESNSAEFKVSKSVPKFVTLYASDVIEGKIDAKQLKGAIVRRCYDVAMNEEQRSEMDELVSSAKVYEEDSSVFVLGVSESESEKDEAASEISELGLLVDKFDYIKSQVDKISHPAIDNGKLIELMKSYYERAMAL